MSVNTPAAMSPMIRSLLRLWCHETTRTYSDRLFSQEQRLWFSSLLRETVEEFFCSDSSEAEMEILCEEQEELPKNTSGECLMMLEFSRSLKKAIIYLLQESGDWSSLA